MSEILQDLSAPALVKAIEENQFEGYQIFRHWPRAEVYDGPDMLWTITDIPNSMFNNVFRAQLAPDNVDAAIEAVILWLGTWARPQDPPTWGNICKHTVSPIRGNRRVWRRICWH
jgi:hypothetical protein